MSAPAPEPASPAPRLLDAGEAALVVEFGDRVDPALSDRVLALADALQADPPDGLRECVPTYRSLMIHYDPLVLDRGRLATRALALAAAAPARAAAAALWTLPCCYDRPHGEDLQELAGQLGLAPEAVVGLHAGATYRVYMYGFAPGYAYLGGLPERLAVPRRRSPRPPHPAGAVMLAGGLAGVATVPMPTGWYVVGATPARLYAPERAESFFASPGDAIRFEPVDADAFAALAAREAAGERIARKGALGGEARCVGVR